MGIDIDELMFDDENEAKFAAHGVTVPEVEAVLEGHPRFHRNGGPSRRASHVMIGSTDAGRVLLVPIERIGPGVWRPTTAFEPSFHQAARSRRSTR